MEPNRVINTPGSWLKLIIATAVVFALFQFLGTFLHSDRGQFGLVIGLAIVATTVALETLLFTSNPLRSAKELGLGLPAWSGILIGVALAVVLIAAFPLYSWMTNSSLELYPGWISLLPGLFAQSGIAEETLFRGFVFGHLRSGRRFWRAAAVSAIPFVIVHLFMFATLEWPIALAGLLLSVAISFPMARLFELGGRTIWAPAILHFAVQGAIKILTVTGAYTMAFPLVWMILSAVLPFAVFLVRRPDST